MNRILTLDRTVVLKVLVLDMLSVLAVYTIPAISHMLAYPLYLFDPMRLIVLMGFMVYRNKWNSCALAVTLPLVSFLLSGHPVAIKNGLIAIELLTNILLLAYMLDKRANHTLSLVTSISVSKMVYYGLKYTVITFGFLNADLVATDLIYQVIVVAMICTIWFIWDKKICKSSKNIH